MSDDADRGPQERGAPPEPVEGLAWLGRAPTARSNVLFATLWHGARVLLRASGLRVTVEGTEHRPATGGYLLAIGGHRRWIDGPLVYFISPREPRIWYLGNAVAIFRRRWLERLLRAAGGMLPVYRGGTDIAVHLKSAEAVLSAGAIFAIYPEGTRHNPPAELGRFRRGIGYIGLRTGARILPVALAGTVELYRGRRITYRILPPVTALELAGLAEAPAMDTPEELEVIGRVSDALRALIEPHYEVLCAAVEDPPGHPRRWRWMTGLFD
jgi:1-acyl-sn-glycerol-3-phosphate acyltransferase